ncbi:MAG: hypothetical protein IMZ71_00400 [Chloroflexi bacterium]|nr:hypothetical protein [Chloroflexota bacterium]
MKLVADELTPGQLVKRVTDRFWHRYAEKCNGATPAWKPQYQKLFQPIVKTKPLDAILKAVDAYFDQKWWFTWDKANSRPTWSPEGFCQHFNEVQSGVSGKAPDNGGDILHVADHYKHSKEEEAAIGRIFGNGQVHA